MNLYEIPAEIAEVARAMLDREDERFYFVSTVDQMRYSKLNGVHVATKLLQTAFGEKGQKRVTACFKHCVELGLMTCDGRYKPASPGNPGFSKTYCLASHLLKPQDVATSELSDADDDAQHRDGPSSSGSAGVAVLKSQPIARCAYPAYVKIDERVVKRHREKMKEAMKKLGWDCCSVDVTPQLGPSLRALECPMTDADVVAYYHAKGVGSHKRRKKVRFDASSGNLSVQLEEEKTIDASINELRKSLRNLAVGNVRATRKNGRVYHTATEIPTEYRRRCRFRMADGTTEAAVDVDVSAMHWWELSTMIKEEPEYAEERKLLAEVFESGTFYEFLRSQLLLFGANLSDREREDIAAFKKAANAFILFGKRDRRGSLQIAFREALPGLSGALRAIQSRYTLRQESFILTRLEGTYTLDYVMTMMHDAGIPCLPYHDGCLVPESAVQVCIDHYRQAMILMHGHAPLIRAKGQGVTSEDIESAFWDEDCYFDLSDLEYNASVRRPYTPGSVLCRPLGPIHARDRAAFSEGGEMKSEPVVVTLPNTSEQKMEAIVRLSAAIVELSKALASTHVDLEISHCQMEGCETGIYVSGVNDAKIRSCHFDATKQPEQLPVKRGPGRPRKVK